jgi:hypothetical protein
MNRSHTSKVYRKRLKSEHGWPLWEPVSIDHVSLGDIGYLRDGKFYRMFNIDKEQSAKKNDQVPGNFQLLDTSKFKVDDKKVLERGDHRSSSVTVDESLRE